MIIYSDTTVSFIQRIYAYLETILMERNLNFKKNLLWINNCGYYLKLVVFDGIELGYFQYPNEIGLNRNLIFQDSSIIKNVLGHEIAHFLSWIFYKDLTHGVNFKAICSKYSFLESKAASMDLNKIKTTEPIVLKVQKLFNLAKSANQHEAELATAKANAILLRYNLDILNLKELDNEYCTLRILPSSRSNGKKTAICKILNTFYVSSFYSRIGGLNYIELFGRKHNVEICEFVAKFLDFKLEELYIEYSKKMALKGSYFKDSFMHGISDGFISTISKNRSPNDFALIKLDADLNKNLKKYIKLKSGKSTKIDKLAFNLGLDAGKKLRITTPINQKEKNNTTFLLN